MSGLRWLLVVPLLCILSLEAAAQAPCTYEVTSATLDFGAANGDITSPIDITGTISVTCSQLLSGVVNRRVCLSLPAGTGGVTIADRRMRSGENFIEYQLYSNPARTVVWGELGGAVAIDFTNLTLGTPQTRVVTIHARVFGGQAGKNIGSYLSSLSGVGRWQNYLLVLAPNCSSVTGNATTLSSITPMLFVAPQCTILAADLDFGTIVGLDGHGAATNLSVTCSASAPYEIALDGGSAGGGISHRRMRQGPDAIDYQLYLDSGHTQLWGDGMTGSPYSGTGNGVAQSVPVHGWIPPQGPKPAGTYTDIITATVTY